MKWGILENCVPGLTVLYLSWMVTTEGATAQTFTVDSGATLNTGVTCQGVSWIDIDQDTDLDLFISTGVFDTPKSNPTFRNNGSGVYGALISAPLTTDLTTTAGQAWGDFDNNGYPDLFVCNYGTTNTLYRNLGSLFDKPPMGHLTSTTGFHANADWGDYDNDGFLDLIVCPRNVTGPLTGGSLLVYHNDHTGGLQRVTSGLLATTVRNYAYATWIDYDSDGDLDLFASCGAPSLTENDILFRNMLAELSVATFVIETNSGLTADSSDGLFPAWGDYNNDGLPDMYLTTWDGLGSATPNILYRGTSPGHFVREISPATGSLISGSFVSTGATWGDYDNDGDLDLWTSEQTSGNNRLHRNNGDGTFTDVTSLAGIIPVSGYTSHGAVWGDDDYDGDLDLFVTYAYIQPNARCRIYRNSGNANHWLTILCQGFEGNNRSAIGTKIRLLANLSSVPTWQYRTVSSQTGYFSENLEQHFGLRDAVTVDSLIITWPNGMSTVRTNLPANNYLVINDCTDSDGDGVVCNDNCPFTANPGQEDNNHDGIGDACCCIGDRGNVDNDPGENVDIADLTLLVDHLFISFAPLACPNEANVDATGDIDIADLTALVDFLFISFTPLAAC